MEEDKFRLHHKPGYSSVNAYWLCEAAALSYGEVYHTELMFKHWWGDDFCSISFLNYRDIDCFAECFVAVHKKYIVISFTGTESINDWRTNLNCKKIKSVVGNVHFGFNQALTHVINNILSLLSQNANGRKIYITGHSLGGALAVLCAAYLKFYGHAVDGVYTYGQPRVGGKDFAKVYNKNLSNKTFRHVNNNDIVPHLPLRGMKFRHTWQLKYFNEDGKLFDSLSFKQKIKFWFEGIKDDLFNPGFDRIKDHNPGDYLDLTKRLFLLRCSK
ncbi:lipase family protein [bacterium]|nr:lipase family protein [bacterium]